MLSGSNNQDFKSLTFERATNCGALCSFTCGQDLVDGIIKELDTYLSTNDLFLVKEGNNVVALFCLGKYGHALFLPDKTKDKMRSGIKPKPSCLLDEDCSYFQSAEISLLAVREDCQGRHIGSFIIEQIMERLVNDDVAQRDFLIVRALCLTDYSAIPFYEKCGFTPAQEKQDGDNSLTMYRIIRKPLAV